MNLTLKVIGDRVKPGTHHYTTPQTEEYDVASVNLQGSSTFVAASLRALAKSIDPNGESA